MALEDLGRRSSPQRADSRDSRTRLIDAVGAFANEHQHRPIRLSDLTTLAGVSPATAYRHFTSADDAINAFLARLPERAVELFDANAKEVTGPIERLHQWNEAWVASCRSFSAVSVGLRSTEGFLARRKRGEPVVRFVCDAVEPLLRPLTKDPTALLLVWNAVSDPREVLDMAKTLRWSAARSARFITDTVTGAATPS